MDLAETTDLLRLLGDKTRARLLLLLAEEELTVGELTRLTGLTQSRVSSHLGRLKEAGLVRDRRDGAFAYHALNEGALAGPAAEAWEFLRTRTSDPLLDQDRVRIAELVAARAGQANWADSVAGQMERHYSPGRTWEATAKGIIGLARLGDVADVASGDGVLAELLAPRARSVTCLDRSARVVQAGRTRLRRLGNVSFQQGDMHRLPFREASFDQALLMNALTYSDEPGRAVAELHRVLRPGGALILVTLRRHAHPSAREKFDHVVAGFEPEELLRLLEGVGFEVELCAVTSMERRAPHYEVVIAHARRAACAPSLDAEARP